MFRVAVEVELTPNTTCYMLDHVSNKGTKEVVGSFEGILTSVARFSKNLNFQDKHYLRNKII